MMNRHRSLKNSGTVYQLSLRMFTPEGTLRRATEQLPHIARTGAEFVYLTPIAEADPDTRREFWSNRQKMSRSNNPRNPYRLRDYFKIDPEYGNDDDLRDFVDAAHRLGLRVLLDLVYFHCGPTAVTIDLDPDFVLRDEEGKVKPGSWHFPINNFKNPAVRDYFFRNMEYFVKTFRVDGYRCDVAGAVPLDFWEEARRRLEAINPEIYMITESEGDPRELVYAFECAYGFSFIHKLLEVLLGTAEISALTEVVDKQHKELGVGAVLRGYFNHDTYSDLPLVWYLTDEANNAALVLCFTLDGVPFLYNGQEICDHNQHNMFFSAGNGCGVDWSRAQTEAGQKRMELIQKLTGLRRAEPGLFDGSFAWCKIACERENAKVLAFVRNGNILAVISLDPAPVTVFIDTEVCVDTVLTEYGARYDAPETGKLRLELAPYGWLVTR